jgi:Holliday junction resolvase
LAKPKSTSEQGKLHEEDMVKLLDFDGARRSPSSGASWNDNTDVVSTGVAMECESTSKKSYSLKLDFWKEVKMKSRVDRIPTLGIEFLDVDKRKTTQLVVMDVHDFVELLEAAHYGEAGD